MSNNISTITVNRLLTTDTIKDIKNYITSGNYTYFRAIDKLGNELLCGPVVTKSKEWEMITRKMNDLKYDRVMQMQPSKIVCSKGKINVYKRPKSKTKMVLKRIRGGVIAISLISALGFSIGYGASQVKNYFVNNPDKYDTIVNKVDDIMFSGMDSSDLDKYYSEIYQKDPNNQAAKNYFNQKMAQDRENAIQEAKEEESRMLGR